MEKRFLFLTSIFVILLLSVACGQANEEVASTNSNDDAKNEENQSSNESAVVVENDEDKTKDQDSSSNNVKADIAEASDGEIEEVFRNEDPGYVHDMDGFIVSVDKYQIFKVTDMQEGMYEFDDETEGYVIISEVTIDNTTDKNMYWPIVFNIQMSNKFDFLSSEMTFVRDVYPVSKEVDEHSQFGAGEKVTGLVSFVLTTDDYENIKSVKPKFVIQGGASENKDFSGSYPDSATFDFAYSSEQKQEAKAEANRFYQDDLILENIAEKKMIFEKKGIDDTKQLEDLSVTLNGVQYTEVIPSKESEAKFSNFKDGGVVAITAKLTVENKSNDPITVWSFGSEIKIDGDRGTVFPAGSLEPESLPMEFDGGEKMEKLHVFLLRKDEFETMKSFDLEFGNLMDKEERLFKGKTVGFSLPR